MKQFLKQFLLAAAVVLAIALPAIQYVDVDVDAQQPGLAYGNNSGTIRPVALDSVGALFSRPDHPTRILCALTTTATTSTLITGCSAPGASTFIYVTDIAVYGGVAQAITAAATIQSGTDGACGTGTTVLFYCQHGATAGCTMNSAVAAKGVSNGEICLLDAATGTKFVTIRGFTGP